MRGDVGLEVIEGFDLFVSLLVLEEGLGAGEVLADAFLTERISLLDWGLFLAPSELLLASFKKSRIFVASSPLIELL